MRASPFVKRMRAPEDMRWRVLGRTATPGSTCLNRCLSGLKVATSFRHPFPFGVIIIPMESMHGRALSCRAGVLSSHAPFRRTRLPMTCPATFSMGHFLQSCCWQLARTGPAYDHPISNLRGRLEDPECSSAYTLFARRVIKLNFRHFGLTTASWI